MPRGRPSSERVLTPRDEIARDTAGMPSVSLIRRRSNADFHRIRRFGILARERATPRYRAVSFPIDFNAERAARSDKPRQTALGCVKISSNGIGMGKLRAVWRGLAREITSFWLATVASRINRNVSTEDASCAVSVNLRAC